MGMRSYRKVIENFLGPSSALEEWANQPSILWTTMQRLREQGWEDPISFPMVLHIPRVVHHSGFFVTDRHRKLPPRGETYAILSPLESCREKFYRIEHDRRWAEWELETWIETGEWP